MFSYYFKRDEIENTYESQTTDLFNNLVAERLNARDPNCGAINIMDFKPRDVSKMKGLKKGKRGGKEEKDALMNLDGEDLDGDLLLKLKTAQEQGQTNIDLQAVKIHAIE